MAHWSPGPMRINPARKNWNPDDQQRKYFEDAKRDLECFFISYKEGVNTHKLYGKIAQDSDVEINFKRMGFTTFGEFLYQCRDILRLKTDGYRFYLFLKGYGDPETDHVRLLVTHQSGKSKYKGFVAKQSNTFEVSIDTLLNLHYDLSIPTEQQPAYSAMGNRGRANYQSTSSFSSTVPLLKPLNAAAAALNSSLVPDLQPTNAPAASIPLRPQSQPQSQSSSTWSSVPATTSNKVPALVPFHVIQQRLLNNSSPPPQASTLNNNSTALPYRDRGHSIHVRKNLPRPPPMRSLERREVTPGMARAVSMALDDDDDYDDYGVEYLDSDDSFSSCSEYLPPQRNSLEDVSIDEIDNALKNNQLQESQQSQNNQLPFAKIQKMKISTGGKQVYTVERQMRLSEKPFQANFLGADAHGYIYIQVICPQLQDSFKRFIDTMNNFYHDENKLNEFRMRVDEMKVGILVVVCIEDGSYCRGRIDEVVDDVGYCFIFDIDNCAYYIVNYDDIYHVDSQFTCVRRLPLAVMCLQRGTEQVALTSKFEGLFTNALSYLVGEVTVSIVSRVHPLFKVPVVTITCNEQDLGDLICKGLPEMNRSSITSFTAEQEKVMTHLENRCHVVPSKL